jgi:MFS family permease
VVVAGAALANAVGFGTAYSFGAFFDAMADDLDAGRGATAFVFGITLFFFFGLGAVSGNVADRIGPRPLLVAGAVLMASGLALTSQVEQLWLGYCTYGIGVGVGAGLFVTPMFSTVGGWFVTHRALALGITATGSGVGTLVISPAAEALISRQGWRDAYLILSGVALVALLTAAVAVAAPPIARPARGDGRLRLVAGTGTFQALFWSGLAMSLGLYVAFGFIVPFAEDDGVSSQGAALLVGLVGAASIVGRLAMTGAVRRYGPVRLLQGCLAVTPLAYLVWMVAGGRYGLLVAFALVLGVAYGGYVALGPEVIAHHFGVVGMGGSLGLLYLGAGLGGLVGPPFAGWLADASGGHALPIATAVAATVLAAVISVRVPRDPVGVVTPPARPVDLAAVTVGGGEGSFSPGRG